MFRLHFLSFVLRTLAGHEMPCFFLRVREMLAGKNLVLAGVKAVALHDPSSVELRDLSAQFFLTPEDVGSNTAEACKDRLQELNASVAVSVQNAEISLSMLANFQVRNRSRLSKDALFTLQI